MKTIPKFTDLIAEAVRFEEDSPDELNIYQSQRQRYYFKNGFGASLVLWSDTAPIPYKKTIEVTCFDDEYAEVIGIFTDDKGLREAIEEIKNLKAKDNNL